MNIWPWSRIRDLETANRNLNRRLEAEQAVREQYGYTPKD